MVGRFSRVKGAAQIEFTVSPVVNESSWFALRSYGARLKENTIATPLQFSSMKPTSNVHSAPIYVTLKNRPGIEKSARSRKIAQTWLARLEDVEAVLAQNNMEQRAILMRSQGIP